METNYKNFSNFLFLFIKLKFSYRFNNIRIIKPRMNRSVVYGELKTETRHVYKILVRKPEVKRPLGKSRRRCKDITKSSGKN
jgi:hypothetical protein